MIDQTRRLELIEKIQKIQQQEKILKELKVRRCKKSLLAFTEYTKKNYKANWHHKYTARKLDDFITGKIKKLMIYMPPQHGKTELGTRRTVAKILGDYPDKKVAICAYNHTVAASFNRDIQKIMDSEEYLDVYPNTRLSGNTEKNSNNWLRNSDEFQVVDHEGSLVSVGVGGGLTSKTVDMLIIDDVYKDHKEAWSPLQRKNVTNWFDAVAETRLHNESQILIIFTRWHDEDLAGYILDNEDNNTWEIIKFPALKVDDDNNEDPRKIGEALWEERHSKEKILRIKKKNPVIFASLYQQNPKPLEGLLYNRGFRTYNKEKLEELVKLGVPIKSYTDTADSGSDFLATFVFFEWENKVYIKDVLYTQKSMDETVILWAEIHKNNSVNLAKVEYNNGGRHFSVHAEEKLKQVLKYHKLKVTGFHQTENKVARILSQSAWIQENIFFPENWHMLWEDLYLHLTHYTKEGKNQHDDAEDALTGVAEMVLGKTKRLKAMQNIY